VCIVDGVKLLGHPIGNDLRHPAASISITPLDASRYDLSGIEILASVNRCDAQKK
jgi:hypothetical protein